MTKLEKFPISADISRRSFVVGTAATGLVLREAIYGVAFEDAEAHPRTVAALGR